MKICAKHPELKGSRTPSGNCRGCAREASAAWRKAHPERIKAFTASYHKRNRETLKEKSAAWHKANPEKSKAFAAAWRQKNPDRVKHHSLKRVGFTQELFEKALRVQRHRCAVCRTSFKEVARSRMHADHCHKTGAARGILCSTCNTGLGKLGDSVERLKAALAYLENPPLKELE